MATFIQPRTQVYIEQYTLAFRYEDDPGAGYGFPCDRDGNVKMDKLSPEAKKNLEMCQTGQITPPIKLVGVEDWSYSYWAPAIIKCIDCGKHVTLDDAMTNDCRTCGRLYNGFGQALAPKHQWEEADL